MPTLEWLNDDEARAAAARVKYRLLQADPALAYGDPASENMLIHGDNLDALKALKPYFGGRVKCVAMDPPYNTHSAFEHYDDNVEHSTWLSLMYPRLEIIRDLLDDQTGSVWVHIDDSEAQYLKIIMDEIFGRDRFVATIVWQKRYSRENREAIGDVHEYIFVYAMNRERFKLGRNCLPLTENQKKIYKNPNNDPRGAWRTIPITAQAGHGTASQFYEITSPSGKVFRPPDGNCWRYTKQVLERMIQEGKVYFGKAGNNQPTTKRFLSEVPGVVPWTWWPHEEAGHTDESKKESLVLFGETPFDTAKPERLIHRILTIATNPGDLVLDPFLGSGTTAAVAHKMGRRWIGIEMGEHAVTHCAPRLKKVVDGEQGGISSSVNWKGGGGFQFYKLGPTIFDENDMISEGIRFAHLAAHVWFTETHTPLLTAAKSPLLGVHNGTAVYLLFNGILGDQRLTGGNVLTAAVLRKLPPHDGPKLIYAEMTNLPAAELRRHKIELKQTPCEIRGN